MPSQNDQNEIAAIGAQAQEDSKYKPHLPRISKYPNWDFFASECLNDKISVEDGQCLNSH